jgi:hypothetical protein
LPAIIHNYPGRRVEPSQYPDGLYLGGSTLEYFPKRESFEEKIAIVKAAMPLAKATGEPLIETETRNLLTHLQILKSIFLLLETVYVEGLSKPENGEALKQRLTDLETAVNENSAAAKLLAENLKIVDPKAASAEEKRLASRTKLLADIDQEIKHLTNR